MKNFFKKIKNKISQKGFSSKKKFLLFSFVFLSLFSVFFFNQEKLAISSQSQNVSGYAWSSYDGGGIGWISFNCTEGGASGQNICGSVDYGVHINQTNGSITGYAWSSNYGWLKFGGLNTAEMPTGGGTTQENAIKVGNEIRGWARFCAPALDPVNCSGNGPSSSTGNWDGWVSLKGNTYGVVAGVDSLTGYAWAGDDNGRGPGFIHFNAVVYTPGINPTVNLSATPYNIPTNGTSTLTWSGVGLSPNGCERTGGVAGWPGTGIASSGSWTTPPLSDGIYTFNIQCLGADNVTLSNVASASVSVGQGAQVDIFAVPQEAFNTQLNWAPIGGDGVLTNCVASGGWVGPKASTGIESVNVPTDPTTFTITCDNSLGVQVFDSVPVFHPNSPESITLINSNIYGGTNGVPYLTDFTWTTEGVNSGSCVKSSSATGTGWSGNIPVPETASGRQLGIIVPATAPATTRYILTCDRTNPNSEDLCDLESDLSKICVYLDLNENSTASFGRKLPRYREN